MFCPNCGYRNSQGVNYCVRCGASLIAEQPDPQTTMNYSPGESPESLSLEISDCRNITIANYHAYRVTRAVGEWGIRQVVKDRRRGR